MNSVAGASGLQTQNGNPRGSESVFLTLHERDGRFRATEPPLTIPATDALRKLLSRTCSRKQTTIEVGGKLYLSEVYQSDDDPAVAYAETDRDGVPVDAPKAHWKELSERFRYEVFLTCHASDALTPDTRISLDASFVPPSFDLVGSSSESTDVTWERLRDYARVHISGSPGSGKTSCLRRLALEATQSAGTIPLFLQLRHLTPESLTIDGLVRLIKSQGGEEQLSELRPPLNGGRLLLLLDGLDEISSLDIRRRVVQSIAALCNSLPRIRIFVTSRDFTPGLESLADFTQLSIRPASDQWIRHWLLLYFSKRGNVESANQLTQKLAGDADLVQLTRSPLLLSLIASSYRRSPRLLNERAELLANCVETLTTGWDSARDVIRWSDSGYTPRQLLLILRELSLRLASEKRSEFTLDDIAASKWASVQDRSALVILDSCATSGLVRGVRADTWTFAHRSFQDYLAASYLVSMTQDTTLSLEERIDEPLVRRTLSLSCSLASDPDELLKTLLARSKKSPESAAILFAEILGQESSASASVLEQCADLAVRIVDSQLRACEQIDPSSASRSIDRRRGDQLPDRTWACILLTKDAPADRMSQFGETLVLLRRACFGPVADLVLASLSRIRSKETAQFYNALRVPGEFDVKPVDLEGNLHGLSVAVRSESGQFES